MLLTISTTHKPATDLGYLLHKSPGRCHSFELSFGNAHVFYPEATEDRCRAALLLDIDPVGLVRDRRGPVGADRALAQYVNDRPYVASSFLSVAISKVFGTAMSGRSKERQELAEQAIPLEAKLPTLPSRGGETLLGRLFEPLGYQIEAERLPLDEKYPEWGASRYFAVTLRSNRKLRELLDHLYVLIPVLDDDKHYWVGEDEVKKLLAKGSDWLAGHPERELIVKRYLRRQARLTRQALAQLLEEDQSDPDGEEAAHATEEDALEERISLADQRVGAIIAALKSCRARSVADLGCGEGKLLRELMKDKTFDRLLGMDVSYRALENAQGKLRLERMPERQRQRVDLVQGSLVYRDARLTGYDAAVLMEVIEHLEPSRLASFQRVVFEFARPRFVVITTPNAEYNVKFEDLPAGRLRHRDHRFEWTRAEFRTWAEGVAGQHGYSVRYLPVGPEDLQVGAPTQLGLFSRE